MFDKIVSIRLEGESIFLNVYIIIKLQLIRTSVLIATIIFLGTWIP